MEGGRERERERKEREKEKERKKKKEGTNLGKEYRDATYSPTMSNIIVFQSHT
jgi:hypothetical protein